MSGETLGGDLCLYMSMAMSGGTLGGDVAMSAGTIVAITSDGTGVRAVVACGWTSAVSGLL